MPEKTAQPEKPAEGNVRTPRALRFSDAEWAEAHRLAKHYETNVSELVRELLDNLAEAT